MSNHSQRTHRGPSVPSIVFSAVATVGEIITSLWVITGPVVDARHLVGAALGFLLGIVMTAQVVIRVTERQIATEQLKMKADRRRRERVMNTGTWLGDSPGQELTVRWDAVGHRYMVQGWISDHWQHVRETEWVAGLDALAQTLEELEATGELGPVADEGTRSIRARLALPGWDDVPEPDPLATQPTGTEPGHLQRVPVPVRGEYAGRTRDLTDKVRNLSGPARRARNDWGRRP